MTARTTRSSMQREGRGADGRRQAWWTAVCVLMADSSMPTAGRVLLLTAGCESLLAGCEKLSVDCAGCRRLVRCGVMQVVGAVVGVGTKGLSDGSRELLVASPWTPRCVVSADAGWRAWLAGGREFRVRCCSGPGEAGKFSWPGWDVFREDCRGGHFFADACLGVKPWVGGGTSQGDGHGEGMEAETARIGGGPVVIGGRVAWWTGDLESGA
ncbi:MAG: hypothetical protein KatS3mg132_551 [Limisphaera sp.]|nr:MAG: hypothetical protein KatS3mg132_551 [Limisphaera sp.]